MVCKAWYTCKLLQSKHNRGPSKAGYSPLVSKTNDNYIKSKFLYSYIRNWCPVINTYKYLKRTDHLMVAQLNLLSIHGTVLQYDLSFRILDIRISFVYKNMFLGPAGINFAVLHTSL